MQSLCHWSLKDAKGLLYGFSNPIKGSRVQFYGSKTFAQNVLICPLVIEVFVEYSVFLYCVNSMSELKTGSAGEGKLPLIHALGVSL